MYFQIICFFTDNQLGGKSRQNVEYLQIDKQKLILSVIDKSKRDAVDKLDGLTG